ncbi:hypothetical protein K788_0008417 [Paraburkholderia caribensis MBA4]|uniref:Uncharacterized protein n=1 Tax=Paraburkholderia caribensis MBA4 TaxID=1323664 RepID=A0A0N7JTQ7_9BURK|nr:hypothetical protein [Paraburkholderia caribensis]ALL64285.1 hypothetical protein K788_0008417 [Paraburkholderia caribensis MBA4]
MTPNRTARAALLFAICIAALLVAAFNIINLIEAYGSGPPYYSRTVNMDKWQNPLPVLAAIDVAAFVVIGFCVRWWKRAVQQS